MGLICYQHNAHLVTKDVRVVCAYYLRLTLSEIAYEHSRAGVELDPELKLGDTRAVAAKIMGISPGTLGRFARQVKTCPTLPEDILDGLVARCKPHGPRQGPDRYASGWTQVRSDTLIRDNHRCAICGKLSVDNSVHHIDANKHNNDGSNLITLCYDHHGITIAHPDGELNQVCKFLAIERSKEDIRYE